MCVLFKVKLDLVPRLGKFRNGILKKKNGTNPTGSVSAKVYRMRLSNSFLQLLKGP